MKTFKIFINSLKRSKTLLIISAALGIGLCILFHLMGSMIGDSQTSISIGVNDKDNTVASREFVRYLSEDLEMDVNLDNDQEYLNSELLEKHISAIAEVPKGFEESLINDNYKPIEMMYMEDYENVAFINGYIEGYMESAKILSSAADGNTSKYHELIEENKDNKKDVNIYVADEYALKKAADEGGLDVVIGFYLMIAFILALGFSSMIFSDKKDGTYNRVQATSVNTLQYMIGISLSSIVCSILIILFPFIYLSVGDTYLEISLVPVMVLSFTYALFVVGFSLFVSMSLNTNNSIMAAIVGVATASCILGGAYFPLEYSPEFLQQIAKITPQYWVMDGIRGIIETSSYNWQFNCLVVIMFAVLFFLLSGVRFATARSSLT